MPADPDVHEAVVAVLLQYREQQNTVGLAAAWKQIAVLPSCAEPDASWYTLRP